jgi:hypothetical protein
MDICNSVLPIPQYQNTCWFTVILMCFLRSQYSRKLLLSKLKITDSSPKVAKMIYKLLVKTYIANPKTYEYYKKYDLHKFLKYFIDDKTIITNIIKKGNNTPLFLPLFLKNIEINSLSLYKFDNIDNIYCGLYDFIYNTNYNKSMPSIGEYKKKLDIEYGKKISPDYIFITIYEKKMYDIFNSFGYLDMCNINNFKKIKYDKNLKELKSFKFNNNHYILDSCILNNYNANVIINKKNMKIPIHSIAGITCKNNKYVYNGWIKSTKDPAMLKRNVNFVPCSLIKHDWEVNNKNDGFCLNPIQCKLDNENPKNLCFSFGKGYRTLIFVKTDKEFKSIDENISNSSSLLYPSNGLISKIKIKNNDNDDEKLCKEWIKNKNVNPETKRKIKDTSPIYKKYLKLCYNNNNNNNNEKLCKEWIKNKNVNPETKRKIKDTSPIYKNYIKICNKFI